MHAGSLPSGADTSRYGIPTNRRLLATSYGRDRSEEAGWIAAAADVKMAQFPQDTSPDSTLAFLREGYAFTSKRFADFNSDVFATRLMLKKAVCAVGEDAARMFYHPDRFTRRGAVPPAALMLLQGRGSVQQLDYETHRRRKRMFMSLMKPARVNLLVEITADRWREAIHRWKSMDRIVLHEEVKEILCRAVCEWAGIPLSDDEAAARTREFSAMVDGAGAVGPRNWRGMVLRMRAERWGGGIIQQVRSGKLAPPEDSAVHVIAHHQDADGTLLDADVAAVEMINILRPTVAVAWYITHTALALHRHPVYLDTLANGAGLARAAAKNAPVGRVRNGASAHGGVVRRRGVANAASAAGMQDAELEHFVHEVRRLYPFFPMIGGRALDSFEWRGHRFEPGSWILLDLYGTNHDPRIWDEPNVFRPERFREWKQNPYQLMPQGGGDFFSGHRCAGEWITIELMKQAVRMLTREMRYTVPEQDLRFSLSRMPAVVQSRFVITNVAEAP